VDLGPHLQFRGLFERLQDPRYFATVRVDPDAATIFWPNGADIDPVVLYSWVTKRDIQEVRAEDDSSKTSSRR
jgi:hypothetical protein